MLVQQQELISANANKNALETRSKIEIQTEKIKSAVVADGDFTQEQIAIVETLLKEITTVNGSISTDVQAVNAHVTKENDRVLANIPEPKQSSVIKSIQRGSVSFKNDIRIKVSEVDLNKSFLNVVSTGGSSYQESTRVILMTSTEIKCYVGGGYKGSVQWELIEYV